jgi:hypothetical protein
MTACRNTAEAPPLVSSAEEACTPALANQSIISDGPRFSSTIKTLLYILFHSSYTKSNIFGATITRGATPGHNNCARTMVYNVSHVNVYASLCLSIGEI